MEFNKENMPKHIAIIMDGNRRWARAQGKPASFGHKAGAKTLEKIVRYANKIGLEYITVYAFSTENWKRTEEEVRALMMLLQSYLDDYSKRLIKEKYLLMYILNESKQVDKYVKKVAKRKGLKVITLAYEYHDMIKYGKTMVCPKIEEFLSLQMHS